MPKPDEEFKFSDWDWLSKQAWFKSGLQNKQVLMA